MSQKRCCPRCGGTGAVEVEPTGEIEIWTDGSAIENPGPGAWAYVTNDGRDGSGIAPATTSNRMEITAAIEGIRAIAGPITVISDSKYVVNAATKWIAGWQKNGWSRARGGKVLNDDLWRELDAAVKAHDGPVRWRWVRGHSGVELNEIAHNLASDAARAGFLHVAGDES